MISARVIRCQLLWSQSLPNRQELSEFGPQKTRPAEIGARVPISADTIGSRWVDEVKQFGQQRAHNQPQNLAVLFCQPPDGHQTAQQHRLVQHVVAQTPTPQHRQRFERRRQAP